MQIKTHIRGKKSRDQQKALENKRKQEEVEKKLSDIRAAIDHAIESGEDANFLLTSANEVAANEAASSAMFMLASEKRAEENKKMVVSAMDRIAKGEEYVPNAVIRGDLAQYGGDMFVGLYWGKAGNPEKNHKGGYGLSHIGAKHGADTIINIIDVLCDGNVDRYVAGNKTVILTKNGYECVLALTKNGNKETWLLSGWGKIDKAGGIGEVSTHSDPTQGSPTFSRTDLGAALSKAKLDIIPRIAKDNLAEKMKPSHYSFGGFTIDSIEGLGIDEAMLSRYANAIKSGNLKEANLALSGIRKGLLDANPDLSPLRFSRLMRGVEKWLTEKYGDIEALRQKHIDAVMAERNAMEAARKRAEEEERNREAQRKELSLLSEEELDNRYFEALENGDEATAREMVDEAARRKGYGDAESDYQGVGAWSAPSDPGYATDEERRNAVEDDAPDLNVEDMAAGFSNQPMDIFIHPQRYSQGLPTSKESARAIQTAINAIQNGKKDVRIKVYRAVPMSVKEGKLRNGDWVTPSRAYAELHGENRLEGKYRIIEDEVPANELWWDSNDVNEWGYDNSKNYRYKNTKNNRKLNDLVTRDEKGEIVPPSKRFDYRRAGTMFMLAGDAADERQKATDKQGNLINEDGTLKVEKVRSIDELTDADFTAPTRNVELPHLPQNVDAAIGADGKPVVVKKNIFERNAQRHPDISARQSREILQSALYTPDLYGQNQKAKRPYNWVVISTKDEKGKNRIVLLEVNHGKDNIEVVHWHYLDGKGLEKIKKQAEREDGQLLILPSEKSEEAGALSSPTPGLPSGSEVTHKGENSQVKENKKLIEAERLYQSLSDHLGEVEQEWEDKILDYIYEHYPTQATTSADTYSEQGLRERKALREDPVLKKMREDAKTAFEEVDKLVSEAFDKLEEIEKENQEADTDQAEVMAKEIRENDTLKPQEGVIRPDYDNTHNEIEKSLGADIPENATVEDIDAEIKHIKELRTEANKEYLAGQPHSDVAKDDATKLRLRLNELAAKKAKTLKHSTSRSSFVMLCSSDVLNVIGINDKK